MGEWDFSGMMPKNRLTGEYSNRMKPKPEGTSPIAIEAYPLAKQMMQTPTKAQFLDIMQNLVRHTVDKNQIPKDFMARMDDYYADLQHYPRSLIKEKCEEWRRKPDSPLYFPTIGQLKEAMHRKNHDMQRVYKRICILAGQEYEQKPKATSVSTMMQDLMKSIRV